MPSFEFLTLFSTVKGEEEGEEWDEKLGGGGGWQKDGGVWSPQA